MNAEDTSLEIRTATPSSVRQVNRAILLELIRRNQPISRANLARLSGIFRSSVSNIVDALVESGLVLESEPPVLKRGRTPKLLSLNDSKYHVAGVNIRPKYCQAALAGLSGKIKASITYETPNRPEDFAEAIARAVKTLSRKLTALDAPISRIGIAIPGHVEPLSGRVLWVPTHPELVGFFLMKEVERLSGIPAIADNDCSAGVLSEFWLKRDGARGTSSDFVFLNASDFGVGAGAVLNGQVYVGYNGLFATEFGHITVDYDGPVCYCGRRGCLELYTSNQATWDRYCPGTPFSIGNFEQLLKAALTGEQKAVEALQTTANFLGIGIGNIAYLLNPSEVVVAGRIVAAWELIAPALHLYARSASFSLAVRPARFAADDSLLHGAACLALRQLFELPDFGPV